jgi:hypothetical protein
MSSAAWLILQSGIQTKPDYWRKQLRLPTRSRDSSMNCRAKIYATSEGVRISVHGRDFRRKPCANLECALESVDSISKSFPSINWTQGHAARTPRFAGLLDWGLPAIRQLLPGSDRVPGKDRLRRAGMAVVFRLNRPNDSIRSITWQDRKRAALLESRLLSQGRR